MAEQAFCLTPQALLFICQQINFLKAIGVSLRLFLFGKITMKGFVKKMYHKWPQRNSPDSKGKVMADLNRDSKTTSLSTFLGTRGS
jgi:hypothetical protein